MKFVGFENPPKSWHLQSMDTLEDYFVGCDSWSDAQRARGVRRCATELCRSLLPSEDVFNELVDKKEYEQLYRLFCVKTQISDGYHIHHIQLEPQPSLFRPARDGYDLTCYYALRLGKKVTKTPVLMTLETKPDVPLEVLMRRMEEIKELRTELYKMLPAKDAKRYFHSVTVVSLSESVNAMIKKHQIQKKVVSNDLSKKAFFINNHIN